VNPPNEQDRKLVSTGRSTFHHAPRPVDTDGVARKHEPIFGDVAIDY